MMKEKKIVFVSATLGGGGAERVMSYILNYLASLDEWKVYLIVIKSSERNYLSTLNKRINVINLNLKGRVRNHLIKLLKLIIKIRPAYCFVGLDSFNRMFAPFIPVLKLFGIKIISRETNVLSKHYGENKFLKTYYRLFYNWYDRVIAQSKDMANDLVSNWGIKKGKISLINNPIDVERVKELSKQSCPINFKGDIFNFIFIGRLSYQKGLDILLERLKEVDRKRLHLYILGEGEEKNRLLATVKEFNLEDTVTFLGFMDNPYPCLTKADAIILPSRYEGFPNVLLEANVLGIPIFCNICEGGINEIVNVQNGIAVDFTDPNEFQRGLQEITSIHYSKKDISDDRVNQYSFSKIMPKYLTSLETI